MTVEVRDSYDSMAQLYAEVNLGSLEHNKVALAWLARFAELAGAHDGTVVDVGCGPGHFVNHLCGLGLQAVGLDLSPGQIAEARAAFPDMDYHVADFTSLDYPDSSLGGIVSHYSLIHMVPGLVGDVFGEWLRVLEPGAPALVSFFGARSIESHGTAFDHKVVTAYALFPATVAQHMQAAGFTDIEIDAVPIPEGGRPFDQATVLARKPRN